MDIKSEIKKRSLQEDIPVLLWLFSQYHLASTWRFVAKCDHIRYGDYSYQVHRVWKPTNEGRILYNHKDELI
jgi:hypothetical protein